MTIRSETLYFLVCNECGLAFRDPKYQEHPLNVRTSALIAGWVEDKSNGGGIWSFRHECLDCAGR